MDRSKRYRGEADKNRRKFRIGGGMVAILARVPLYLLPLPISLPKGRQGMERLLVKKKKSRQTAKSEDRIVHRSQKQTQACSSLTVAIGNILGKTITALALRAV